MRRYREPEKDTTSRQENGLLDRFQYTQIHMGVPVRLTLYASDASTAERAARAAYARFAELEQVTSDYRPTSELMRLCARSGGPPVSVSRDLFNILERAQRVARESGGAFDVTIGPLVQLWRQARRTGALPRLAELRQGRARVGWHKMRLDPARRTVQLLVSDMRLDLGGIAKGFAGDEAQRTLRADGVFRALVEAGGDIVVSGPPPNEPGWRVKIANQPANAPASEQFVTLANGAISSSGDTEQYVVFGRRRYSHIVDPRTGLGLTNRIAMTVIAPDGLTSDSLSTALSVLGEARGRELIRRHYYPSVRALIRSA